MVTGGFGRNSIMVYWCNGGGNATRPLRCQIGTGVPARPLWEWVKWIVILEDINCYKVSLLVIFMGDLEKQRKELFERLESDAPNFYEWLKSEHGSLDIVEPRNPILTNLNVNDSVEYKFVLVGPEGGLDKTKVRVSASRSEGCGLSYGISVKVSDSPGEDPVILRKMNVIWISDNLGEYIEQSEGGVVLNYTGRGCPEKHGVYPVAFEESDRAYIDNNNKRIVVPKGLETLGFDELKANLSEKVGGIGKIGTSVYSSKDPEDSDIPFP